MWALWLRSFSLDFFILGWSDSLETYLPLFCPESQGLAASILEPKWLKIVESQLLECKYSLDPPVFTMVPVLLTMPECIQFRDCIILFKKKKKVYETAKETLMYRTVFWTLWERERVGRFGRMALKHVKYHV